MLKCLVKQLDYKIYGQLLCSVSSLVFCMFCFIGQIALFATFAFCLQSFKSSWQKSLSNERHGAQRKWKSISSSTQTSIPTVSFVRHLGWILMMSLIQCCVERLPSREGTEWNHLSHAFSVSFFLLHFSCWSSNMVFYCVSKMTIFTGLCVCFLSPVFD